MNNYSYENRGEDMGEKCNLDICASTVIHQEVIDKVKDHIPDEEILYDLSDLFKVFGDTTRIKILCALFQAEMCM